MTRTTTISKVDVLVVGAGPAGIAAAWTLCRSGAKVLLLDRYESPGKKACAGGLTREAMALSSGMGIETGAGGNRFSRLAVRSPIGDTVLASPDRGPILETVHRPAWQMARIRELRDEGVEIRLGERLRHVEGEVAVTARGAVRFGALVGADGAASGVRRMLGVASGRGLTAWQVRVPRQRLKKSGVDCDLPTVWFDAGRMRSGYGWSFPFEEEMRLGVSIAGVAMGPGELKRVFTEWLRRFGLDVDGIRRECATIPCGYGGHRFGRVYLAGDAAGLASPVTGEGIAQALISGREVAREILDGGYRSRIIPALARRHRRVAAMLGTFGFDRLLTFAPLLLQLPPIRRAALERFVIC